METTVKDATKKNKANINVTVSPYISRKMDRLVTTETFSSISDLVSVALTEFLVKFPDPEEARA